MARIQVEEVRLQLTFGWIAGKWWGSKDIRPILMLHGWQDNAGSFDTLIPHLPTDFSYLAIDWPGHGLSSHYPQGHFYHMQDLTVILEEIRVQNKWEKISVIAHSMGAVVAFLYSSIFPSSVDFVCAIDALRPPPIFDLDWALRNMRRLYVLFNQHTRASEYSYEEIVERTYKNLSNSINRDKVGYLVKRGVKQNDSNKFEFNLDIPIRYIEPLIIQHGASMHYIKQIKAPYLFIKTEDRRFAEPERMFQEAVKQFNKYNPNFEVMYVKGTHHVHLNHPTLISEKICAFLTKHYIEEKQAKSKL